MKTDLKEISTLFDSPLRGENREIELLLTDSRSLTDPARSLFFALKGPSNDGHRYIEDLYRRGVRSFVVEKLPSSAAEMADASWIVVADTLLALQKAGSLGRRNAASIVAITGSRGKTTLKE